MSFFRINKNDKTIGKEVEKRKEYIDQLLIGLKEVEEKVVSVKNDDALPFSFFKEAFDRLQEITRCLHNLELLQIDEMKQQMQRLVLFLSETETLREKEPERDSVAEEKATCDVYTPQEISVEADNDMQKPAFPGNMYAENVVFPDFKDPRIQERKVETKPFCENECEAPSLADDEKPIVHSFNDTIQAPPSALDFKRSLSLNDRFLFQRELFNNDASAMNGIMLRLEAFDTYSASEQYLKEHTSWNFEDKTVKDFLDVVKRRFE